jgi:hypothetical protein
MTFDDLMARDVEDTFLKEFSHTAVYIRENGERSEIKVQLFEESLDRLDSTYLYIWASYKSLIGLTKRDKFEIDHVFYGITTFDIDEHKDGVSIFLNKVS